MNGVNEMVRMKWLGLLLLLIMVYKSAVIGGGIGELKGVSERALGEPSDMDSAYIGSDWQNVEYTLDWGALGGSVESFGRKGTSRFVGKLGVTVETFTLPVVDGALSPGWTNDTRIDYRSSGPVLRASLAMEIVSWVGMLVFLPDANDYKREWLDPEPEKWARDFRVEYTNNNNGVLVDYVFHPMLGATMYGYSRSSGANYFSALVIAGVHNALWELKELPHAGSFAAQDFVTTFAASGIAAMGDMLGDTILDNSHSVPLRGLAYLLKAPSSCGNLLYFVSLGIHERRKTKGSV